ncbi:poly-beta-1,6-N-acetyl-D-glucosamine N-deacetylase PgaB [Zymobacter sp. IVIA_5232.4 C2]|uniref:poly-beta-1,6-N-acetyl-D-glucosamine N-deacetylase PgaB n=1 Tax=Zymobacter sp. IVIA_5232.4 C2 TaxID=3394855 RepID=UPI0039C0C077
MMMKRVLCCLLGLALPMLNACAEQGGMFTPPTERPDMVSEQPWPKNHVLVLAYHDIMDSEPDQQYVATRTANFVAQMRWLKANHYVPVSMDQIFAARDGKADLPEKAVLLTFDDGYRSMYDRVFPILKRNHWPALFAPVGAWLDTPQDQMVNFSGKMRPRDKFVTWDQVREMSDSGLIEIASHTQDMHKGIIANPQGNVEPAAAALAYDPAKKRYETLDEFRHRFDLDATTITNTITRVTGKAPRVWVWPYGASSGIGLEVIKEHGYQSAMTLDEGLLDVRNLMNVPRTLVAYDPNVDAFSSWVADAQEKPVMRTVRVDLDYVYDPDPKQMDENVGRLIQRLADLRPSVVMLQAFSDPKGDGLIKEVYFPNSQLPMRADLLNRVTVQIHTRMPERARVFVWMPVLTFDLKGLPHVMEMTPEGKRRIDPHQYRRLTPFNSEVRARIKALYRDMAVSVPSIEGVAFHDDLVMSDYEDVSDAGLAAMRKAGFGDDVLALRKDHDRSMAWARYKGRFMNAFTKELMDEVHSLRGTDVKSARNIFIEPVLNPDSEEWFAQNLDDTLDAYDYVMPMLMPYMEGVRDPKAIHDWMARAVERVRQHPNGLQKTIFELQAQDWRSDTDGHGDRWISSEVLGGWMKDLFSMGVVHLGYYPDDFYHNTPSQKVIRSVMSPSWAPD